MFVQGTGDDENSYEGECTMTVQKSYFLGVGVGITIAAVLFLITVIVCALNIKGSNDP